MSANPPPEDLRRKVLRDLEPVKPLRRPWRRALTLVPVAMALLGAQVLHFGLREDAHTLGFGVLWGASALQVLVGLVLLGASLRQAVPGRALAGTGAALLAMGLALSAGVTLLTWHANATFVPSGKWNVYWKVCYRDTLALGAPTLVLALVLALRAFPLRPALVGALAGLGAGLVSDAGWRTYCEVSDPRHVFLAHLAAVATLALLGALGGWLAARTR